MSTSDDGYAGIVSTRGSYSVTATSGVQRKTGHSEGGFQTEGVPGYDTDDSPNELAVFVHGFQNTASDAKQVFQQAGQALDDAGYGFPLVGYSWDSHNAPFWASTVYIAWLNGRKLANFLFEYGRRNPDTQLQLITHSLGSQVALSALEHLYRGDLDRMAWQQWSQAVQNVSLLGAAVDARAPEVDGTIKTVADISGQTTLLSKNRPSDGRVIDALVGRRFDCYYSGNDTVLWGLFETEEQTHALGYRGLENPNNVPDCVHQTDVTASVPDHSSYYAPGGCMQTVVANWKEPV